MHALTWPASATSQASVLAGDWRLFTYAGIAVLCCVWGLIGYAALRWRRRDGDALPPQFRTNNVLEIGWTALPLALAMGLFVYTYRAEAKVDAVDARPAVSVAIEGYRWGWTFAYAGGPVVNGAAHAPVLGGTSQAPPELVLPLGETTRIDLSSRDVVHGFWVPDMLFQRDAIPGQPNRFDLRPDKVGVFAGHCAQFCGIDHALMGFTVRVVSRDAFERWRRTERSS